MGGGFHIENPNAVSSCGCGSSFRTARTHTGEENTGSCGHN
jgi:iron-sulfur cluster assembly protein